MRKGPDESPSGRGAVDRELLIFVAIFVIAAAGIVFFAINPDIMRGGQADGTSNSQGSDAAAINHSEERVPQSEAECLAKYGIESSSVVFIYSDTCIYSNQMKPWVQQLESAGYSIFWANTKNSTAIQIVSTCLAGTLKYKGTPEFICPSNKADWVGIFASMDELRAFADRCE